MQSKTQVGEIIILVCDYKAYGQDCSLRCGNCSNGETCQHVNGSCLHGCDAGVSGEQCNDGNNIKTFFKKKTTTLFDSYCFELFVKNHLLKSMYVSNNLKNGFFPNAYVCMCPKIIL